ncbi:hypothetical protein [Nocardia abscessus]|uniref:hypothetical protein n=1 Tax=Nocardia abscessus TaxID=120957 RepID=UPI0024575084|nr:hypothetical protein [Nocardia abscessus]
MITWPVLTGLTLVLAGRWWLLRESIVDRLINGAIAAALCEHLLREAWFEQSLTRLLPGDDSDVVNIARQLSLGATVLAISHIYGIVELWAGTCTVHSGPRHRGGPGDRSGRVPARGHQQCHDRANRHSIRKCAGKHGAASFFQPSPPPPWSRCR